MRHGTDRQADGSQYRLMSPPHGGGIITLDLLPYAQGDSDTVSFHIYASWFFAANLWVKLLEMFVTLLSLKYAK